MKKLVLTALVAVALILVAAPNAIAQSATAASAANATILIPISIVNNLSLEFGNIAACGAASVVRVNTAGARSLVSGCAVLASGAVVRASDFTVSGEPNRTYAITLPGSVTLTSGGNNMTVDTFASNPSGTGTLSGAGSEALAVGADLHVGAGQAAGSYTGTFDVTVVYN